MDLRRLEKTIQECYPGLGDVRFVVRLVAFAKGCPLRNLDFAFYQRLINEYMFLEMSRYTAVRAIPQNPYDMMELLRNAWWIEEEDLIQFVCFRLMYEEKLLPKSGEVGTRVLRKLRRKMKRKIFVQLLHFLMAQRLHRFRLEYDYYYEMQSMGRNYVEIQDGFCEQIRTPEMPMLLDAKLAKVLSLRDRHRLFCRTYLSGNLRL